MCFYSSASVLYVHRLGSMLLRKCGGRMAPLTSVIGLYFYTPGVQSQRVKHVMW